MLIASIVGKVSYLKRVLQIFTGTYLEMIFISLPNQMDIDCFLPVLLAESLIAVVGVSCQIFGFFSLLLVEHIYRIAIYTGTVEIRKEGVEHRYM